MEAQGELLGDGRCEDSSKAPSVLHAAASRVHSPLERRAEVLPESLFVYSCFYPAGEGPFRAGFESAG
jgi:hypothetical protein